MTSSYAQAPAATGEINGRVFDTERGRFLDKAHVTVDGTSLETFTDDIGQYRLVNVPAGQVTLRVLYTGRAAQVDVVTVEPGRALTHDIKLAGEAQGPTAAKEGVVQLATFTVNESPMNAAAIAANEERYARNLQEVVTSDQFGLVVDGTPGEVMKFLPGVAMNYNSGEPRTVSVEGVSDQNVPITVGGFNLASAASGGNSLTRNVNLDQFSVNSISRVEVQFSPTPESEGSALSGQVNFVPRSAFERLHPEYKFSTFFIIKSSEITSADKAGPWPERKMRRVTPAYNLAAVVPVNRHFGFTVSANSADQYSPGTDIANATWYGVEKDTDGKNFPTTTPDNPYLTYFELRSNLKENMTDSFGTTLDFRPTDNDVISLGFQYTWVGVRSASLFDQFNIGKVNSGGWGPTFTTGAPGSGGITIQNSTNYWTGTTATPSLTWRHNGGAWRSELGVGESAASLHNRMGAYGFFGTTQAYLTAPGAATGKGATVSFADIDKFARTLVVTDQNNNPLNPFDLQNYSIQGNKATDSPFDSIDVRKTGYAYIRRDFSVGSVPVTVKGGFDFRGTQRDQRAYQYTYTYNKNNSPSINNNAAQLLEPDLTQRPGPYGYPSIPWLDNRKYWNLLQQHPDYFTNDPVADANFAIGRSKVVVENVYAQYLRTDASFFHHRLEFTGGVRREETYIHAQGPDYGKQVNIDRGAHVDAKYQNWFPDLNAAYWIRENFAFRAAYYQSIGRPNLNQYAGGIGLPDTTVAGSPTSNNISINNPDIKPWTANTVRARLEYYFANGGQISAGGFVRDFKNFFGTNYYLPDQDFLRRYNLDPAVYGNYWVKTNYNSANTVRMKGLSVDYRQALTFLPSWARGFQIWANTTALWSNGPAASNFSFVPHSYNWGISFNRPKYEAKVSWNYRGLQRTSLTTSSSSLNSVGPSTYNWNGKLMQVDVYAEYRFKKHFAIFANVRNIFDATNDGLAYGPLTPKYARLSRRWDYNSDASFGLKGTW